MASAQIIRSHLPASLALTALQEGLGAVPHPPAGRPALHPQAAQHVPGHLSAQASASVRLLLHQGIWNRLRHERKLARGGSSERRGSEEEADVEVEQKFLVPEDCRRRLEAGGAVLVSEAGLGDVYWDTAGCNLLARDHWLRQR